ncbi:MAG: hypothetical protein BGO98_49835 [Myxococcales bacterium 68-20]|nr:MAG: hypothetical protein BGO98_49835 [Myxococcales bacterium 68-20]
MNRSYPAWLVGCALVFAGYGCAADATSIVTTIEETETPAAPSNAPSPETEREVAPASSNTSASTAASARMVETVAPVRMVRPAEELQGPQPVPWCSAFVCGTVSCPCLPFLFDEAIAVDFGARAIPIAADADGSRPISMPNDPDER